MDRHGDFGTGKVHQPFNWSYADATARGAATGMVPADVGKWARQEDDGTYWELTDDSPVTWAQRTGTSFGGSYTDEQAQDAVGGILSDAGDIDFTYDDGAPSITAAVKAGAVTYAKMQDVSATDRILGRDTAGAGDVEELDAAAVKGILGLSSLVSGFTVNVGDGVNVITSSEPFVLVQVPFAATITANHVNADASGNLVFGISKAPAGSPTSFSSIVASAPPTLSGAQSSSDSTLTGWTTAISAGDWLKITVTGTPATIKRAALALVWSRAL